MRASERRRVVDESMLKWHNGEVMSKFMNWMMDNEMKAEE